MIINKELPPRAAGEIAAWCGRFRDECRRRGIRMTAQRLAIYRALAEDRTHPCAEKVYERLRPGMGGLSLATVYRILESLEQEGFVHRIRTTDGVWRFDANLAPHQHLVCRKCGSIADSEADAFGRLRLPPATPGGFVAERLDIWIIGTCSKCAPKGGRKTGG